MNWKCFGLLALVSLIAVPVLAVEPIIHYKFEDSLANSGTGGSKYDAKVYSTTDEEGKKPNGSIAYIDGPVGKALDVINPQGKQNGTFVGVKYDMDKQGTLAMWYYAGDGEEGFYNYESIFDGVGAIADPGESNSYNEICWEAWIYDSGMLRGRINHKGKGHNYFDTVSVDMNAIGGTKKWCHLAITWDKNDKSKENMKIYVNGQLSDAGPICWATPPRIVCFGGGNTGNQVAIGAYDDVKIYDSALAAPEIAKLVGDTKPVEEPKPVIHYKFEDNLSNSGSGGKKLDGKLEDGSDGGISYTTGVKGKALSYDNAADEANDGDYVKVDYTLPDEGAISVWYKPRTISNHNTIWDSVSGWDRWKCAITGNARIKACANNDGSGDCSFSLASVQKEATGELLYWEDEWYHITYTWSKEKEVASLYINGRLAGIRKIENWVDPGDEFYLGGGHAWNDYGVGICDDLMIFKDYLTSAQVRHIYDSSRPASKKETSKDTKKGTEKETAKEAKKEVVEAAQEKE